MWMTSRPRSGPDALLKSGLKNLRKLAVSSYNDPYRTINKSTENQQGKLLFLDFIGRNTWAFKELIQTSG
jgi:hypothetical protein